MSSGVASSTADCKPTVLIVDDEAAPRAALTQILRRDFHILTAESAQTAMAVLNDRGVDLVTLDLRLPDGSGTDLLDEIKRTHAEIEVIMVTAFGTLQSAMDCIRHGAAGFLLKPFNAAELLTISLQTSHKKQRLDMLRAALSGNKAFWGSEPACTQSWQSLMSRYSTLIKNGTREASAGEPSPLVQLVSDLLEARDRHLVNHANRVSFYATLAANKLKLSLAEQNILSLGALAHDLDFVGQGGEAVLEHEHDRQQHRPDIGARIGGVLGLPADAVQIIALHHERWDGSGYPFGLQGERIPTLARLVALAQAFDHLTAARPGASPMTMMDAIERIEEQAGSAFDPALSELFCKAIREQPPQM